MPICGDPTTEWIAEAKSAAGGLLSGPFGRETFHTSYLQHQEYIAEQGIVMRCVPCCNRV